MKHHRVLFVFLVVLAIISLCSGIVAGEQDDYYEFVGGWGAEDFHPYGVAVARYLVVTSHPSEKPIYVFDTSGNFVESWGVNGNAEGNVHPGSFDRPYGVDADPNGEYYFADTYNHRVQRWGKNFEYIVGGIWSYWMHPNTLPKDIAAGETEVYVTDPANNLVATSDKNGGYHRAFYSGGDIGFLNPTGVAINPNNQDFFVVDSGNNCIHRFDNEDVFILQWGSEGSGNGQFHNPTGITVDKYGHVYVVDSGNNRIQVFDTEGRYITQWGSKGSGNGQFSSPYDIAVQPMGPDTERAMVYVSDTGNNRIQIFKQTEYLQALLADFSILEMGLEAPMEVIFLDNSAGDPEYWFWDFDDGKPVSEQNPHHVYEIPGTYTVTLRIMKVVGGQVMSSTISKQIVVTGSQVPGQGLQAGFTAAPLIGEAPLKVTFTDTSTGDPQFWNYNFGDGRSDSSKNPVHTYSSPGNYTVTLTVRRLEDGQMVKNTAEKQIVVTGGQVPGQGLQAGFTTAPLAGDTSLKVAFTDNSTGDPQFWSYNFGDGRSDSSKNPVHTYSAPGNYTVTLTVMKLGNGQMIKNTAEKQIVVTGGPGPAPQFQAGFTADPVTGKAPLKVTFTDTSTGDPQFWNYNFGDGRSDSSKNPVHTYSAPGNYPVTLTVMKLEDGLMVKDTAVKQIVVTGSQAPGQDLKAGFTAVPLSGGAPLKVTFTDTSSGDPQFWSYNFGDGGSDSSKNPVHTYSAPGNYTVTLTVRKLEDGQMVTSTAAEKQIVVTGGPGPAPQFQAGFTADPVTGKAPLKVAFTDTSSGDPKFWNYNFGDGTSGSSKNPVHTYLTPGNYTVTLSVMKVEKGTLVKNSTVNQALIMVT